MSVIWHLCLLRTAVKRQLNVLRRNGVTGDNLLRALIQVYQEHGMKEHEQKLQDTHQSECENVPYIVCSEAMV